jgi:tetratricopeptide (TPR) repeat protein
MLAASLVKPYYRHVIAAVLLIVVATAISYSSVRTFEFNNYDDILYVTGNDLVKRGLTPEGIATAFTEPMAANWHPLTMISHMVDVELFGLNAGAHHLVNAAFHLANSLLLFAVLFKMTRQLWPSAAVGLLFAVHPLHVESVTWVAERKDVLSGFFALLTIWAYTRYAARLRWLDYALVLLFLAAGLLSKPMLVTTPVLLLLLDYWPLRRFRFSPESAELLPRQSPRRLVLEKVPLLLLALGSSVATIMAQTQVRAVAAVEQFPLIVRIANAIVSYAKYVGKTLWPVHLSFHYPHPGSWPLPIVAGAFLVLLIVTWAALAYAQRSPWMVTGWLWFLVGLLPVIGLVQVGSQAMADRYMYLPLIGLAIIAVWGVHEFVLHRSDISFAATSASLMTLIVLAFLTRAQTQHWRSSESLYVQALRLDWSNGRAHELLARTLTERGDYPAAIRHYSEALHIHPKDELLHYNLGYVLVKAGAILEATNHLAKSLQLCPTNTNARFHLAHCFNLLGDARAAESNYLEVLKVDPNDHVTKMLLGHVYLDAKDVKSALNLFSDAVRQRPESPEAQHAYGVGLLKSRSVDEAMLRFQQALKLNPSFAPAHRHLAEALVAKGRTSDAITSYREAIRLRPEFPEALNDLAWLLATHPDKEVRNAEEAGRLAMSACDLTRHQQPVTLTTLAAAYAETGRFEDAVRTAERALAIAKAAAHSDYMQQAESVLACAKDHRPYRQSN